MKSKRCSLLTLVLFALVSSLALPVVTPVSADTNFSSSMVTTLSAWDRRNNPELLNEDSGRYNYEYNLASLPTSGDIGFVPWTDSYWPDKNRGLAFRWTGEPYGLRGQYYLPEETVRRMSPDAIRRLSPAEKYDIYMGRFDYPLTKSELSRTNSGSPGWFGLCHGWAVAALQFYEPGDVEATSRERIRVHFGASDIKGLLSLMQGNYSKKRVYFAGSRCGSNSIYHTTNRYDNCLDINPGAFHVIVTNRIGLQSRGFVMDKNNPRGQVWNQPVFAYRSRILGSARPSANAARGTRQAVLVSTVVSYTQEIQPQFRPLDDNNRRFTANSEYRYTLELDGEGNIIGGEWNSYEHPDFLWFQDQADFGGLFSGLKGLYKTSIR